MISLRVPVIFLGLIFTQLFATEAETEMLTRKKNNSLSIVLLGLAQSCNQVSELLTAEDQTAKQQGILNVISTVLATTAQLSSSHAKPSSAPTSNNQTKQPCHNETPAELAHLSTMLFEEIDQQELATLTQTSPLLTELMATESEINREELTRTFMASPTKANLFIDELFALLNVYLTHKIPLLTERVKQNIIKHLGAKQ